MSNSIKYWRSAVGLVHGENYETKLNQLETENEELRVALQGARNDARLIFRS